MPCELTYEKYFSHHENFADYRPSAANSKGFFSITRTFFFHSTSEQVLVAKYQCFSRPPSSLTTCIFSFHIFVIIPKEKSVLIPMNFIENYKISKLNFTCEIEIGTRDHGNSLAREQSFLTCWAVHYYRNFKILSIN